VSQKFIQVEGPIFLAVQKSRIFTDSKLFVDSIPQRTPEEITQSFEQSKDLEGFVRDNFFLPTESADINVSASTPLEYIEVMWEALQKDMIAETESDTLISLPHPHIVPGGRFRESYYWDSYFEAVGLHVQDKQDIIDQLIENFCSLIETYGFIPNGNRVYYLTRSQSPFFSHLIELTSNEAYLPYLQKEYDFWMTKGDRLVENGLNRFYDSKDTPREESYYEDFSLILKEHAPLYRHIRAVCESGWDFSSRWLKDEKDLLSAHTCDLNPIDLNALLYHMECTLEHGTQAEARKELMNTLCWDEETGFYFDYNYQTQRRTSTWSLAALYPLFVGMATQNQADRVAQHIEEKFLKNGGLVTTLTKSGQQWDAPNGWAPLQWIAFKGLQNYGHDTLATECAQRFLETCSYHFEKSGTFLEKYNMESPEELPQDGEYALQTGFGWTNGVYAALTAELSEQNSSSL